MEQLLRENEELTRRVLESAPAGIVHVSQNGAILRANQVARRLLGLAYNELTQLYVTDFEPRTVNEDGTRCPAEDYPVSKCLRTGQPQPPQVIGIRGPDGGVAWGIFSALPMFDPKTGQQTGAVVTFLDITERKRIEEALRESEERHRAISELTSDYSYACRIESDGQIVFDFATDGFTKSTGYTLEEVAARGGWQCLVHPEDLDKARRALERTLAGETNTCEVRSVTKFGRLRWVRFFSRPVWGGAEGRVVRVLGAVQDITERKLQEAELQDYAQRLRRLSQRLLDMQESERRHLALELHDEVGQILTGLKLALEDCERRPERIADSLCQARGQIRELTERLRNLSLRLRPTMLDDLGLVPALLWLFERYTAQTGIEVHFERGQFERRFPPSLETAAFRIVQEALTNVARHAGIAHATVRLWVNLGMLGVQIEDRGKGFDIAEVGRQATSGLSGMQERAEWMGGMLTIDSFPGRGTRVTAEIPIDQGNEGDGFATLAG